MSCSVGMRVGRQSFLSRLIHEVFRISKYDSFVMLQHLLELGEYFTQYNTTLVEPLVALITSNTLLMRVTNIFFIFYILLDIPHTGTLGQVSFYLEEVQPCFHVRS